MSETLRPNFMRYRRVADVVATERIFASKMGTEREVVLKPNGDKVEFPKEIILITDYIHANGHDANSYGKKDIIALAGRVIVDGEKLQLPERPAEPEPQPEAAKPAEKPKRKPKAEATPKKPKVKKKPEPAAAAPAPTEAKPEEPAKPEAKAESAKEESKPKRSSAKSNGVAPITTITMGQNGVVPFAVGCAVNSNLIAASQLLEIHDDTDEGKQIRERLDKIIDEIQKRTVIPSKLG